MKPYKHFTLSGGKKCCFIHPVHTNTVQLFYYLNF